MRPEKDFHASLSTAWQARARVNRSSIFGDDDNLLPIQNALDASTAAPGYVGENYKPGGLLLVSINPAGGKDGAISTPADLELYQRFRNLRDSDQQPPLTAFQEVNSVWAREMPQWSVFQQHTCKILQASGQTIEAVAYIYVVPFRTRGDVAAKIKPHMLKRALPSFLDQVSAVRPGMIVSMDRMAEAAGDLWVRQQLTRVKHWYYTRKRDAHRERAMTLEAMSHLRSP